MLCRGLPGVAQNDGRWLAGGAPDVAPCVVDGLWRVGRWRRGSKDAAPEASGWCVEGRRVANRRRSGLYLAC